MILRTIENIEDDEEYLLFRDWIATADKSKATSKSYLANFRRLRNIIGKDVLSKQSRSTAL